MVEEGKFPFTMGQIRNFLMKKSENGLDSCVRKIGKRIYFREDLFVQWIERKNFISHQ